MHEKARTSSLPTLQTFRKKFDQKLLIIFLGAFTVPQGAETLCSAPLKIYNQFGLLQRRIEKAPNKTKAKKKTVDTYRRTRIIRVG